MPAPRTYIAHQHSKNRYHRIEHDDSYNQSCDAEASAEKMQDSSAGLRVIAQIVRPKLRKGLWLFRHLRLFLQICLGLIVGDGDRILLSGT
jgi:hypothetical protein